MFGDWKAPKEAFRWETSEVETVSRSWSGTMRNDNLVVTVPGMTVGSNVDLWTRQSVAVNHRNLLPGPETEILWTVSEGSRHREERTEAGLFATDDNCS